MASGSPARIVFLGSPACCCSVLQRLWEAAPSAKPPFEVCAVVSRPPRPVYVKRKKVMANTDVQDLAEKLGVERILLPESAKDKDFLQQLEGLKPDMCITAAYGEYLPKRFRKAPRLGTLNVHPSLLPRWRGASPVQRSLVAGDNVTGVTILYTVAKMDAGPIAAQSSVPLLGSETTDELLDRLFAMGADMLIDDVLPRVLRKKLTRKKAKAQDASLVTLAPLIAKDEGRLYPHNETAMVMRNKVRGFSTWPGATLPLSLGSDADHPPRGIRVKVRGAQVAPLAELNLSSEVLALPTEELVVVPRVKGVRPVMLGVRPAADPQNVLLLEKAIVPGRPEMSARVFAKNFIRYQPARWLNPEDEARMSADGDRTGFKYGKKRK